MHFKNPSQLGATMVEAALVMVLFMTLVTGIIDLGILFSRYSSMAHLTATVSRKHSVSIGMSCSSIENTAESELEVSLKQSGLSSPVVDAEIKDIDLGLGPGKEVKSLSLNATWNVSCFFCLALPRDLTLSVTSLNVISSGACA